MMKLTQNQLKSVLYYSPETGVFTRIKNRRRNLIGKVAGGLANGYIQMSVSGKLYLAHRLAWLYIHGRFPENQIDHIDQNKKNNALANLRACSCSENMRNTKKRCDNTSGYKGATWNKHANKYSAKIGCAGKYKHLGYFDSSKKAAAAYNNAALKLHGEFACLNNIGAT